MKKVLLFLTIALGLCTEGVAQDAFTTLCAQAGVVMCTSFDDSSQIPDNEDAAGASNWRGLASFTAGNSPVIDNSTYNHGGGALKFTIPAKSGAGDSGYFYTNMNSSFTNKFTAGNEFWFQWRQRFDMPFITTAYTGGDGWKLAQIFTGDTSGTHFAGCVNNELVLQNTFHQEFIQAYDSCQTHTSYAAFWDLWTNNAGTVTTTEGANPANNNRQQPSSGTCRSDSNPTYQNCIVFYANEWMTFKVHIVLGSLSGSEWINSQVQVYVARQNQAGQLAINIAAMNLNASSVSAQRNFGKITLLPYNTNRSSAPTWTTTYTWYDDLIVSTSDISMTYGNSVPTVSITAPVAGSIAGATAVTATASSTGGATVNSVQFYIDGQSIGTDSSSPYSVSITAENYSAGNHSITAVVTDSNLATATSAPVTVIVSALPAVGSGLRLRLIR